MFHVKRVFVEGAPPVDASSREERAFRLATARSTTEATAMFHVKRKVLGEGVGRRLYA